MACWAVACWAAGSVGLRGCGLRPAGLLGSAGRRAAGLSGQMTFCRRKVRLRVICPAEGRFGGEKSCASSNPAKVGFRRRKVVRQLKSGQSRVSAARCVLIRISYGSPGLSRTDAIPRGLWYGKDPFPVPNGQGGRLRSLGSLGSLGSLRRLRRLRGTATTPCASGPAGCRAAGRCGGACVASQPFSGKCR